MNFTNYAAALGLLATSVYASEQQPTEQKAVETKAEVAPTPVLSFETYKAAVDECKVKAVEKEYTDCMTGKNVTLHQMLPFADRMTADEAVLKAAFEKVAPAPAGTSNTMTYVMYGSIAAGVLALGGGAYYFATRKSADEL